MSDELSQADDHKAAEVDCPAPPLMHRRAAASSPPMIMLPSAAIAVVSVARRCWANFGLSVAAALRRPTSRSSRFQTSIDVESVAASKGWGVALVFVFPSVFPSSADSGGAANPPSSSTQSSAMSLSSHCLTPVASNAQSNVSNERNRSFFRRSREAASPPTAPTASPLPLLSSALMSMSSQ